MLALLVDYTVKPEHAGDFRKAILTQSANSLSKEPACKHFDVCVDPENAAHIFLYEVYDDQAAIDLHRTTPHFANFVATIAPWVIEKKLRVVEVISPALARR